MKLNVAIANTAVYLLNEWDEINKMSISFLSFSPQIDSEKKALGLSSSLLSLNLQGLLFLYLNFCSNLCSEYHIIFAQKSAKKWRNWAASLAVNNFEWERNGPKQHYRTISFRT